MPRNSISLDYYQGTRHSLETWLYNPASVSYLLSDQLSYIQNKYPTAAGFKIVFRSGNSALLQHDTDYVSRLQDLKVFFINYQGIVKPGILSGEFQIAGLKDVLDKLETVLAVTP